MVLPFEAMLQCWRRYTLVKVIATTNCE